MYGLEDCHWLVVCVKPKVFSFEVEIVMINTLTGGCNLQKEEFTVLLVTLELLAGIPDDFELFVGLDLGQDCAVSTWIGGVC
jgi:hypothetical protein